jgi:hypothetical protein
MIQRYIYDIISQGVASLVSDTRVLDEIFDENFCLDDTEVAAIKTYVANHPLTVVNGYSRTSTKPPICAITLMSENEGEQVLGNAGFPVEDGIYAGADVEATFWDSQFGITIFSENPDITAYYYEIVKQVLFDGYAVLQRLGCFAFKMSGADLAPDPQYDPEHFFARQITFNVSRERRRTRYDSLIGKGFKVAGLHVDSSGSPSDVGNVQTLITTIEED